MLLRRLIIITLFTCVAAYTTGFYLDYAYKKRWDTLWFQKTNELLNASTNYDIIFLGNSRVHFGINPYYVDSVTKLNSYNFGSGGADSEDILLSSTLYLQNHQPPKLVVISVDRGDLVNDEILKSRYHYLFYLGNDTINKFMNRAGFFTPLLKIFPFMKYSFFDEYNRTSIFVKGKPYPEFDHNIYKGFLNIHQGTNNSMPSLYNVKTGSKSLSDTAIMHFRNNVSTLQKKGSLVVLVWPPLRSSSRNANSAPEKSSDSVFLSIADEFKLNQFHFERDSIYLDRYFVDAIHLNEPGTRIYSMRLADSIKNLLASKNIHFPAYTR